MKLNSEALAPWYFTIGLFVIWEAICRIFNVSDFILPAPSQIAAAMVKSFG